MTQANKYGFEGKHPTIMLEGFGYRELHKASEILAAYANRSVTNLLSDYFGDITEISFNPNSGNVYAVDADYNCAMMNGNKLDLFLSSPYSGHEGFIADLLEMDRSNWHADDIEWLEQYTQKEAA